MAARRGTWWVALMAGVVLVPSLVVGCSDDGGSPSGGGASSGGRVTTPGGGPSGAPGGGPPGGQAGSPGGQRLDDAWQTEARDAVGVVDRFWRTNWNTYFTGVYRSPRVIGTYTPGTPRAPACGGQPALANNAFYCSAGDFIAWDGKLMRDGYAKGDSWVYLVIAHEWGHAVQRRVLGIEAPAQELQADCLAGATLFGAQDLRFEPGDTDELGAALTELADETPWTNAQDHGNAQQRVSAFSDGGRNGVRACLPA
ncbi:hypothetical protein [Streptomyces sp. NPDC003077]|uniref:hypothetical protein n=1 Tax=Streptomyces sp. NPDC003077 TaxID=3154443 RepID=UPI0033BBFE90